MIRILAALALCSCALFAAASPDAPPARSRYIVTLRQAPLAAHRGVDAARPPAVGFAKSAAAGRPKLDASDAESRAYLADLDRGQAAFLAAAGAKLGRAAPAVHRYRAAANGVALDLTPAEAAALAELPEVAAVAPDRKMKLLTDTGPTFIGATQLWGGNVPGVPGTRGEGIVVGVIDSGLNFAHPSFAATGGDGYAHTNPRGKVYGQCLQSPGRCNGKLIGIYDFTSEGARNGTDLDGHGSHTAATAAGNIVQSMLPGVNAFLPVSGVAPHANLIVYKACIKEEEDQSTCSLSALVSALDQAVLDGVDVINYSIGGDGGDPWQALRGSGTDQASAMLNVRAAGIVPVVAAGNAGPLEGSISDPGNAPWVITAANATHTRRFQTTLTGVTGPGVASPQTFVGSAITGGTGTLKIVNGADFGSELCSQGSGDTGNPPYTGASNPWPPGTFHGEIVVCRRGTQARVAKGYNVLQAGGGGMILVNQLETGESIVSDLHYVPSVHIGYQAGQQLYALLAQAKSQGGNLTGAITPVERLLDGRGDVLSASSSRGPVEPYGGWLKPNLTAPGTDIIAAAQSGSGLAVLSGTSMASPHIAGAAALVIAAHPTWTVSQVESALLTSGVDDVVIEDGLTPASPHDAGGGRAFVPGAVRAGLSFAVSASTFESHDPARVDEVFADGFIGAGPAALNMPYLEYGQCLAHCTFTRTATDNGAGGSWTAELHLPQGATGTVTPNAFTLAPGAQQTFTVRLDVSDPRVAGSWVYGSLVLVNGSGTATNARLPIAVYADPGNLPESITLDLVSDSGYLERSFSGLVSLANPRFKATEIVQLRSDQRTVVTDLTPSDPFDTGTDSGSGAYFFTVPLGTEAGGGAAQAPATLRASLYAQLTSLSGRDADLFVGIDANGDGKPNDTEALCRMQGPTGSETCVVSASYANGATAPVAWFLVQNLQNASANGNTLRLRYGAATQDSGVAGTTKSYGRYGALRVTGPGVSATGAPFNVRFSWNAPGILPGESWLSFLSLSATPENPLFGNIPVLLNAGAGMTRQPVLLNSNERVGLRLAGNTAHERIAIDVPAGAESLRIDMSGTGEGDLYLAKSAGEPAAPAIGQAPPRAAAQGTSIHAGGATETITLNAPTLSAGRWYVTPVNSGAGIADVVISATLTSAGPAPSTNDALYYDPQRSGHGVFLSSGSGQRVVVWYTYLEDGTPAWYLGQGAAPAANQLTWTVQLQRFTWDGTRTQGTEVGYATVVRTDADKMTFDWYLNGSYGSEPMQRIFGPEGCAFRVDRFVDTSGLWYAPAHSGYGWNVLSFSNTELQVNYLYDASGAPRWLLGQNGGGADFTLSQYSGFCPVCSFQPVQSQAAGTLQRTYTDERSGHAKADASFVAPVPGSWHVDDATLKITRDNACVQDF